MSLDAILAAIRAEGDGRVDAIEKHTAAVCGEILAGACEDAGRLQAAARSKSAAPARKERARLIHHARLEALQVRGKATEALVDAALEQARGYLSGVRATPGYAGILRRLLLEAVSSLGDSPNGVPADGLLPTFRLEADPRDREILEAQLAELSLDVPVAYSLACWGGLVARSEDGRVAAINTFEARLARAKPFLQRVLAARFEGQAEPVPAGQAAGED